MSNSSSGTFPVFPVFEEKDEKVLDKNTVAFWHSFAYMVSLIAFITYDNCDYIFKKLFKVLYEKMQKATLCVLRLYWQWFTSMIYINYSMVLLRIKATKW